MSLPGSADDEPVRILHTIYDDMDNPWCGGGGAQRAMEINRRLADRHQIKMLVGNYPGAPAKETKNGVQISRIGSALNYPASRLSYSVLASRALLSESFDLWVYNFSAFSPVLAGARNRNRCILEFFHVLAGHALKKRPLVGLPAILIELYTLGSYSRLIGISPSVLNQIRKRVSGKDLNLVYTGVSQSSFDVAGPTKDYILYFGRLDTYTKGLDLLLKAFSRIGTTHPKVRLILAGRGTEKRIGELQTLSSELGIQDRVEILGPVSEQEKQMLFGGALFKCMPSRYEGWGIAAIETGAAGKAVIGTRIPGLVDAIRHEQTGLLIDPESVASLAEAMDRLLCEPELRNRLGAAGRKWARRFSWDRIANDQEQVYLKAFDSLNSRHDNTYA
jgi:glycosyltransferase involved in cell wall biosynthesis